MATKTFDELMQRDIKDVFLKEEYSQEAIYQTGSTITTIIVQFFEEPMEGGVSSSLEHAWCDFADIPRAIKNKDTLTIKGIVYGIMEASPDEFQMGLNLYLQKV